MGLCANVFDKIQMEHTDKYVDRVYDYSVPLFCNINPLGMKKASLNS